MTKSSTFTTGGVRFDMRILRNYSVFEIQIQGTCQKLSAGYHH